MDLSSYGYKDCAPAHTASYLMPDVESLLESLGNGKRVFEIGFGNGANAARLRDLGYEVTGVEPSLQGYEMASHLDLNLHQGSTDEDLAERFGRFPIVISLEVIEHVFSPATYARRVNDLLEPGGIAIISTPYHGYLKNLALALTGKMESHFTALWEGGHIKFFSRRTLGIAFARFGLEEIAFRRVGRVAPLAKSMIGVYRKPEASGKMA